MFGNILKIRKIVVFYLLGLNLAFSANLEEIETFVLINEATNKVLDSNHDGEVYTREPNGGDYQKWIVKKVAEPQIYELINLATKQLLDSDSKGKVYALKSNGGNYQKWTISETEAPQIYRLDNVETIRFLDSNSAGKAYSLEENGGNYQRWKMVPQNYKLRASLYDFNFGEESEIEIILNKHRKLGFIAVEELIVSHAGLGVKIGNSYGEDIEESFSWGLNQTLGVCAKTEIKSGIPFLAEGKVEVGFSAEFGAHQDWSKTRRKNFSSNIEISPNEPGIYKIGKTVYISENAKLPFRAKAILQANNSGGKLCSAKYVEQLFRCEGLNAQIVDRKANAIVVEITGDLTATYAVRIENISMKVGEIPQ